MKASRLVSGLLVVVLLTLGGCVTEPDVVKYDFVRNEGLYVLVYANEEGIRPEVEQQLVADLEARGMVGHASSLDFPLLEGLSASDIISAARDRDALGVLVLLEVSGDLSAGGIARQSPVHRTIEAFLRFAESRPALVRGQGVIAETDAFLIEGTGSRNVWNGATWSRRIDGEGTAIRDLSRFITDGLAARRDALRPGQTR